MFSPEYFRARQKAAQRGEVIDPMGFCAINLSIKALNREGVAQLGQRELWCFNEVSPTTHLIERAPQEMRIGQSELSQGVDHLTVQLNERTQPFFQRMTPQARGRLHFIPSARPNASIPLNKSDRHRWYGLAPHGRIQVELSSPSLRFEGNAYHDGNAGREPIEDGFKYWTWRREERPEGTAVLYDLVERDGSQNANSFLFTRGGEVAAYHAPQQAHLSRGLWGIERTTRAPEKTPVKLHATLVDSPFYTRDILEIGEEGNRSFSVHEALDLDRLKRRWVRFLMGFKIRQTHH